MLDYDAIEAGARALVLDTDTAISAAQFELIFGDVYNWWQTQSRDRATPTNGTTLGLTVNTNGFTMLTTIGGVLQILSLHRESAGASVNGTPMRWVSREKLYWMRRRSMSNGVPKFWTAWREEGTDDWRVLVHPPADGTYFFSGVIESQATDLDTVDEVADVTPAEQYVLQRLCAYEMAVILDRDGVEQFLEGLLAPLDDWIKTALETGARMAQPRQARPGVV